MHEAVLEDGFLHDAGPFGKAHQGHDLCLHVRGKAWERLRRDIHSLERFTLHGTASQHAFWSAFDVHAHGDELGDGGLLFFPRTTSEQEFAVGDARGNEEGSGFDAVWHDAIRATVQAWHALDTDNTGPVPFNLSTTSDEEIGKVHDFWLAGGIFEDGLAISKGRGHEKIFRTANGGEVKVDAGTVQVGAVLGVALRAVADDIAVFQGEDCAHFLKGRKV